MSTQTPARPRTGFLPEATLARFRERAPHYDQENRFFAEDFEELRAAGYLKIALPEEHGGSGYTLGEYAREAARLAGYAPATALATNMAVGWAGIGGRMLESGDERHRTMVEEIAAGEVFANGHGERGNDLNGFLSTVEARRVDGGYRFHGHKIFGSLSPVWTRLGLWALDANHADGPMMVHAYIPRDGGGYRIEETWDTMGMRATRSDDTILEGAFAPDKYVLDVLPPGAVDPFILSSFCWYLVSFGAVYVGLARRAIELAVESAYRRHSIGLSRAMAYHPEVQHELAEMAFALEPAAAMVERVAHDWDTGVDHGDQWFVQILTAKHAAVEAAQHVVDLAMRISGGAGMFRNNELERLYRDVRCGGFHPANSLLAHEIVGKGVLGIDPGEQPRWG